MATADTTTSAAITEAAVAAAPTALKKTPGRYVDIDVKLITTKAGDNIRTGELPDIEGLAASIKEEGVLEPIIITAAVDAAGKPIDGKYSVVAGHRRLAAVRSLEWDTIPALIIDATADRRLKLALIENIQREDMNPLDKARGIQKLLASTKLEQQEVAQALGVAPGFISQYLGILALPETALAALQEGEISFTQARTLCKLLPDVKAIDDLLFEASDMTVAALDAKVSHLAAKAKDAAAEAEPEEDGDGEDKPKKKRVAKPAPSEAAITYYEEADFHPLKKESIRELMVDYKRKEVKADTAKKREEFRLILKGITLAADLRLK